MRVNDNGSVTLRLNGYDNSVTTRPDCHPDRKAAARAGPAQAATGSTGLKPIPSRRPGSLGALPVSRHPFRHREQSPRASPAVADIADRTWIAGATITLVRPGWPRIILADEATALADRANVGGWLFRLDMRPSLPLQRRTYNGRVAPGKAEKRFATPPGIRV